jgi:hypothetical protein
VNGIDNGLIQQDEVL